MKEKSPDSMVEVGAAGPRRLRQALAVSSLLLAAAACSSQGPVAESSPGRESAAALPYAVFLDRVSVFRLDGDQISSSLPYGVEEGLRSRFTEAIALGLLESRSFAKVDGAEMRAVAETALDAPAAFLEALARFEEAGVETRRAESDLVIRAKVGCFARSLPRSSVDGWAAFGSSVVWFLSMFPAWFIPDRTFEPAVHAALSVERGGRSSSQPIVFSSARTRLDFLDRAGAGEYALQFICPPALVPSDPEVASAELLERAAAQLRAKIARDLPGLIALHEIAESAPFLLPASEAGGPDGDPLIFVPGELTKLEVDGKPLEEKGASDSLGPAKLEDAARRERLERLRSYLGTLAPGGSIPSLEALERRYPSAYRVPGLRAERGARKVRAAFARSPGESPQAATWTLPPSPTFVGFRNGRRGVEERED